MSLRSEIVDAMASLIWADAWSNHVEEHGCERLGGRSIEDIMPRVPEEAHTYAEKWAKAIEKRNGRKLDELYEEALAANERENEGSPTRSSPEAFGHSLAYMAMGAGPSWFDDNAEFVLDDRPFEVPDVGVGGEALVQLMEIAGGRCKAAWNNPACPECGAFSRPGKTKCSNCGEPFPEKEED